MKTFSEFLHEKLSKYYISDVENWIANQVEIATKTRPDKYKDEGLQIALTQLFGSNINSLVSRGMTYLEAGVLIFYTKLGYVELNEIQPIDDAVKEAKKALDVALSKLKTTKSLTYRVSHLDDIDDYYPNNIINTGDRFYSTSLKNKKPSKNEYLLTLQGKSGVDISQYSEFSKEDEVLFPRFRKFRVDSINDNIISLSEI